MSSQIVVTIFPDGTVKVDASRLDGTEDEILSCLKDLSGILGGELTVERHVHHHHGHTRDAHRVRV